MKTRIARPRCLSSVFLGLALYALSVMGMQASPATEWQAAEFNCRLNIPDGWRQLTPPQEQVKLLAQSDDGTNTILLVISSDLMRGPFNKQEGIRGAKVGISEQGGSILAERDLTLTGMPAFEMVSRIPQKESQLYVKSLYVWADGRCYVLSGMGSEADIAQNPEIAESLASFAFLQPPKSPTLPGGPGITPYEVGKLIGTVMGWLAAAVGVVYLIRRFFRKPPPQQG